MDISSHLPHPFASASGSRRNSDARPPAASSTRRNFQVKDTFTISQTGSPANLEVPPVYGAHGTDPLVILEEETVTPSLHNFRRWMANQLSKYYEHHRDQPLDEEHFIAHLESDHDPAVRRQRSRIILQNQANAHPVAVDVDHSDLLRRLAGSSANANALLDSVVTLLQLRHADRPAGERPPIVTREDLLRIVRQRSGVGTSTDPIRDRQSVAMLRPNAVRAESEDVSDREMDSSSSGTSSSDESTDF